MSNFPSFARVVVIGGGAVGASCLYHLAKAGVSDCVLLEKNELTAGSTWHAAGNVPTFSSSWSIMNMQRYSAELYRGLGAAVDYPMNYNVTGSVRLAHTQERMAEFARVVGMGRYQGMDLRLLQPDEIKAIYPFVETHDLLGALYDPYDGDIDPAQLTQALAKGARNLGASISSALPCDGGRRVGENGFSSTPKGRDHLRYRRQCGGLLCARSGQNVWPRRADDGDVAPIFGV
jgi:dimethylglycine dehydrogenase